ncbi:uncharacterized protein LOC123550852 [Mercenaria mercenaria]|uniref:uncharacterized protein LOC123550852 n=1 Tax=Mercenaria mercenaria TaxID=6596 RepID=UPI00234EA91B|nr:uncharacterized protein LOC123550852 [Mercenaria mercenaria]XP_053396164.1 uncharacterized protein LOC123550852 [Mercenaria mercenaria]
MDTTLTDDNERYLRHLLLLGQATPLAVKAVINHEISKRGKTLRCLLLEKKETIQNIYNKEFSKLFPEDEVNAHLDSWDIHSNCVAVLVLFEYLAEDKLEAIKCIRDQRNDLDEYATTAALSFDEFDNKWKTLHNALLALIKDINDQDTHECKRMIHSFYSESILVNYELILKMQQTKNVDLHVQMAIQEKIFPEIQSTLDDTDEPCNTAETIPFSLEFIEELKDTLVSVGEPAILECKLNKAEQSVKWIKNYKPFVTTDTVKLLNDNCSHWMVVSKANPTDSGLYSCVCGGIRTSASLTVSEDPVNVIQDLAEEEEVMENMDVSLVCKIFLFKEKPIWRHNNKEIIPSNRIIASSYKLEHKLTILNATFLDDGEYMVDFGVRKLKTKLTVKGDIDTLHQKQLKECLFKNWIRAVLGLKYLKSGLEDVSDEFVQNQHVEFLRKFQNAKPCTQCNEASLLKGKKCPNKFCSELYQLIVDEHRSKKPELKNTVIQNWSSKDPWNLALCYINTLGYTGKGSAKEIDCAGLLSIFINNKYFNASLGNVDIVGLKLFKKAKDMRNALLHSPNYEQSEKQLKHCINLFKSVLEVKDISGKTPLLKERKVQEAIVNLNELQQKEIDLLTSDELRQTLRDHAMSEAAEKVKEAHKQNMVKLQQLEEKLKFAEQELRLMHGVRAASLEKPHTKAEEVPFSFELHISVVGPTFETMQANQRVYQAVAQYVAKHKFKPGERIHSADKSVYQLLACLSAIKDLHIVDMLKFESSAGLKIHCLTCEATGEFLKALNGSEFQQQVMMLRKCLLIEKEMAKPYDVVASCSSASLEDIRKRLPDKGIDKGLTNVFICEEHDGTHCEWYCSDHGKVCCLHYKDKYHRSCVGMKQVIYERTYDKENVKSLTVKCKRGDYDVRVKTKFNREDKCFVRSICVLPNGNLFLIDIENNSIKKLNRSYKLVGNCNFARKPYDMCYIGNERIAVSLEFCEIQFVKVSGKMKLEKLVKLDHKCWGLACHGATLFVNSGREIYTYNLECKQQQFLYRSTDLTDAYGRIAVSDDGKRIYAVFFSGVLIVLDKRGKHLSTLQIDVSNQVTDVCIVGDGSVLVLEYRGSVYQVDYRGERVLGTVVTESDGLEDVASFCYDRQRCRMNVGFKKDTVSVFELQ